MEPSAQRTGMSPVWGVITIPSIVKFCTENGLEKTLSVIDYNNGQLYLKPKPTLSNSWVQTRKFKGVSVNLCTGDQQRLRAALLLGR